MSKRREANLAWILTAAFTLITLMSCVTKGEAQLRERLAKCEAESEYARHLLVEFKEAIEQCDAELGRTP